MSADALRTSVKGLMPQAKAELAELVSFKSVADAKQFPVEECEKAAQWVIDAFTGVGFQDLAAHPTPDTGFPHSSVSPPSRPAFRCV